MFDSSDLKRVQAQRNDLSEDQAGEVLGFLLDTYNEQPYNVDSDKLFKVAADMMFPEEAA